MKSNAAFFAAVRNLLFHAPPSDLLAAVIPQSPFGIPSDTRGFCKCVRPKRPTLFFFVASTARLTPLKSTPGNEHRVLACFGRNHRRATHTESTLMPYPLPNPCRMNTYRKQGEGVPPYHLPLRPNLLAWGRFRKVPHATTNPDSGHRSRLGERGRSGRSVGPAPIAAFCRTSRSQPRLIKSNKLLRHRLY